MNNDIHQLENGDFAVLNPSKLYRANYGTSQHKLDASQSKQSFAVNPKKYYQAPLTCNGKSYYGAGAINRLCRDLVEQGLTGRLEIYRNDKLVGSVKDILAKSKLSLTENDKVGFRETKYTQFWLHGNT